MESTKLNHSSQYLAQRREVVSRTKVLRQTLLDQELFQEIRQTQLASAEWDRTPR